MEKEELSLVDIFKIFLRRWFILLVALVIGLGTGVSIAAIKNANNDYYGATVMFYVNPTKETTDSSLPVYGSYADSITDTMVVLLESEFFAHEILSAMENAPEAEIDGKVNPEYEELLHKIQESTSFTNKSNSDNKTNNVFYVTISVLNDKQFAETLLTCIQGEMIDGERKNGVMESFVEENMPVPSGYDSTRCISITKINQIIQTNEGVILKEMVKYVLLCGAITFVVGCVIAIFVDKAKNNETYAD